MNQHSVLSQCFAPSLYNGQIFFDLGGAASRKFPFYFSTDKNLPFVEYGGEESFLCWLRALVSAQAILKTLRGDRVCKALSLGEVAAAVRLRIAGFGEGTP